MCTPLEIAKAIIPGCNIRKTSLLLFACFCLLSGNANSQNKGKAQSGLSKYTGKYEVNGMIVQVAVEKKSLLLYVSGAPPQQLMPAGVNTFKTNTFSDEAFVFVEKAGKIEAMMSQRAGQSLELKKISDSTDDFNKGDLMLVLKKSSKHFSFLYSAIDTSSIQAIADRLEANYYRILSDLKVKKMATTTVRIYPDMISFREGINFPNAPDFVFATAFGKNDFRMASPQIAGIDTAMLMKGAVHEFTHCVHLNIDYSPNNPRWLWEGLAMYESGWFFDPKEIDTIKNKEFPQLAALNNGMEYMLGYVIIEAIKDIWGFDTVISLIKKQGNVQAVLNIGQEEFEKRVFESIYRKYVKS